MIIDTVNGKDLPRFLIYDIIKFEVSQNGFNLLHDLI